MLANSGILPLSITLLILNLRTLWERDMIYDMGWYWGWAPRSSPRWFLLLQCRELGLLDRWFMTFNEWRVGPKWFSDPVMAHVSLLQMITAYRICREVSVYVFARVCWSVSISNECIVTSYFPHWSITARLSPGRKHYLPRLALMLEWENTGKRQRGVMWWERGRKVQNKTQRRGIEKERRKGRRLWGLWEGNKGFTLCTCVSIRCDCWA